MIAKSDNDGLKSSLLPFMGTGERAVGIGFSQLRRSGAPICRAEPDSAGFRVYGHVPWVTGWSIFDAFILGAALPDGQAVFGICPLPMESSEELRVSDPMRLAAMETAQTVTVDLDGFHLASDQIVFVQPPGWAQKNDEVNIALQGFFALGCAHAGVDLLESEPKVAAALRAEVEACQSRMEQLAVDGEAETKLKLRAWAIDLSVRCAHAAIAATGGRANSLAHDAQRVYREALVFTVSAQTPAIRCATLDRLVREPSEFMQTFENP
jgi:alkylation response protein AidB-like acyl-CoA dehydrogenase